MKDIYKNTQKLVSNQRRFVFGENFSDAIYMVPVAHFIEGPLDLERLKNAAKQLVMRHEVMRTSFHLQDGDYFAHVSESAHFTFEVIELENPSLETFRDKAKALAIENVDLSDASSLVRFIIGRHTNMGHWVCLSIHHTMSDGVSRAVGTQDFFKLYAGLDLPAVNSFYDFAEDKADLSSEHKYWETFSDNIEQAELKPDLDDPNGQLGDISYLDLELSEDDFKKKSKLVGVRKFGILAAAYAVALTRATGNKEQSFTFQSAGRRWIDAPMDVFGPFSNTLPISATLDKDMSFKKLALSLQDSTLEALKHEAMPFDQIFAHLGYHPNFSINTFPSERPFEIANLKIQPRQFLDRSTDYHLNMVWSTDGGQMIARGFFDSHLFSKSRIDDLLAFQKKFLLKALDNPNQSISELLLALEPEGELRTPKEVVKDTTVLDSFLLHADRNPHAIALDHDDENWTYAKLKDRAFEIAQLLSDQIEKPGSRIAIVSDRSPELIATILGAAWAGFPFSVLDGAYTSNHIMACIEQFQTDNVLCLKSDHNDKLSKIASNKMLNIQRRKVAIKPLAKVQNGKPMYFLFTSGTTGKPKCIGHGPEGLKLYLDWFSKEHGIDVSDKVTMLSGVSHDPVMRDIFLALTNGASIVIPHAENMKNPRKLTKYLARVQPTVMHITPPLARLISLDSNPNDLSNLRLLVWGGDTLNASQLHQFKNIAPNAKNFNLYGMSETPQAVCIFDASEVSENVGAVPIGSPMPYLNCSVFSEFSNGTEIGISGEMKVELPFPIYTLSDQGYKTQKKINTGDHATVLSNGNYLFSGRQDDTIKIRGNRVSLSTLSEDIKTHLSARETLVLKTKKANDDEELIAFCNVISGQSSAQELRAKLTSFLPAYQVPDRVVLVDDFPLLPNGKIDRAALLKSANSASVFTQRTAAALQSVEEEEIAQIFKKVGGKSVNDANLSLIEIGADSMSSIEARLLLENANFLINSGWENKSIQELAKLKSRDISTSKLLSLSELDTFIPARAIAIFFVVSLHYGWIHIGGGSTGVLYMAAGISFASFQATPILEKGQTGRIWATLATIVVSVLPVSLLIYGMQATLGNPVHFSTVGFYSNLLDHSVTAPNDGRIIWFWYIHSYLQLFAVIALALSFKKIRNYVANSPFYVSLGVALACLLVTLLYGISTTPINQKILPHTPITQGPIAIAPLLFLGAAIPLAKSTNQRALLACCFIVFFIYKHTMLEQGVKPVLIIFAVLFLLFPVVKLPRFLARISTNLAEASLYIYLLHVPIYYVLEEKLKLGIPSWLLVIGAIIGIVLFWKQWKKVIQFLGIRRLSTKQVSF